MEALASKINEHAAAHDMTGALSTWMNDETGFGSLDSFMACMVSYEAKKELLKTLANHLKESTGPFAPKKRERVDVIGTAKETAVESRSKARPEQPAVIEVETAVPTEVPSGKGDAILQAILDAVKGNAGVDRAEVEKVVDAAITARAGDLTRKVEIIIPDRDKKEMEGHFHEKFDEILTVAGCREPILLSGPSGGGKTTISKQIAEALDIPFDPQSIGPQTSKGDLMGVRYANGEYIPSPLRRCYENGGVWLADELDAGHAGVITIINAALANGICGFPDKVVERHKDFVCIAAANTWGNGANSQYMGRAPLDKATLNRFSKIPFDYDEVLERKLAGNDQWVDRVQAIRRAVFSIGAKMVVSPRDTIAGARLLAAGLSMERVEDMRIWAGVDSATKEKVLSHV